MRWGGILKYYCNIHGIEWGTGNSDSGDACPSCMDEWTEAEEEESNDSDASSS